MTDRALDEPVRRFVDDVGDALARLASGQPPARLRQDVAAEAFNLAGAFVDADRRHTDEELWAFISALAPHFESQLGRATPGDLRDAGLLTGKRSWADQPSALFDLLLQADRRNGTADARTYYDLAMRLAHTVASLDAHPAREELEAIESFREMLLGRLREAEQPAASAPAPTPGAAAGELPVQEPARPLDELLAELDELVGLAGVKAEVKLVANLIQVQNLRRERGLPVPEHSRHLVFTGNPGTGKTTVARLLAQIYRTLGVVEKGHLVETDRAGLVAGYVGQTALRVKEVFEQALEGVLLIDEAYALARGGERDFGQEATDALVKLVEDHRDDIVVIAAGYPQEMHVFVESNPGLRSRFPKTIHFPDYSDDELFAIFQLLARKNHYELGDGVEQRIRAFLGAQARDKGFGNGRVVRNLFEEAVARQASRIVAAGEPTDAQLVALEAADIPEPASP